jgi:hypothetical protein
VFISQWGLLARWLMTSGTHVHNKFICQNYQARLLVRIHLPDMSKDSCLQLLPVSYIFLDILTREYKHETTLQ